MLVELSSQSKSNLGEAFGLKNVTKNQFLSQEIFSCELTYFGSTYQLATTRESYQKICLSLYISWEPGSQAPREFAALPSSLDLRSSALLVCCSPYVSCHSVIKIILARSFGVPVGNEISGHYKHQYFPFFSLSCDLFSWKECSDQKTYLAKVA